MPRIYIVRHGEAAATFAQHRDPGLSELGREQAKRAATLLKESGPLRILTSPLLRAKETAQPLAAIWNAKPEIDDRFAEVPSPMSQNLAERSTWLSDLMAGTWMELPQELQEWRRRMIQAAIDLTEDCVIFSHFVAINVLVGAALDLPALISFRPDNASITQFSTSEARLALVSRGREAKTRVN